MGYFTLYLISCDIHKKSGKKLIGERYRDELITKIKFSEKMHHFSNVVEGDTVNHYFVFRNTGKNDLKIEDVSSSCGCTIPHWPQKKIKSGSKDSIGVFFTKKKELGVHTRSIIVRANTDPEYTVLQIYANVVQKNK